MTGAGAGPPLPLLCASPLGHGLILALQLLPHLGLERSRSMALAPGRVHSPLWHWLQVPQVLSLNRRVELAGEKKPASLNLRRPQFPHGEGDRV